MVGGGRDSPSGPYPHPYLQHTSRPGASPVQTWEAWGAPLAPGIRQGPPMLAATGLPTPAAWCEGLGPGRPQEAGVPDGPCFEDTRGCPLLDGPAAPHLAPWPWQELGRHGSCSMLPEPPALREGPLTRRPVSGPYACCSSARVFCLSCRPRPPERAGPRSCKAERQPPREQGTAAPPRRVRSAGGPAGSVWPPAQAQDCL